MKKYVRAVICIIYTDIKLLFMKLFHWKNFSCSMINICSPFSEITLNPGGYFELEKVLKCVVIPI